MLNNGAYRDTTFAICGGIKQQDFSFRKRQRKKL